MTRDSRPVAVVTGAASGIGWALACQLAGENARVVLVDRDARLLAGRAATLGGAADTRAVDVTTGLVSTLRDVAQLYGRLDFVFNNAGVGSSLAFDAADDDHWDRILALNLRSVIDGTRAAYALMRELGGGHIVNTASVSGLVPFPGQTLYNTTKYAIVGLSTTLRPEAARHGIRVSVVCPGRVATPIWSTPLRGPRGNATPPPPGSESPERAAAQILHGVARNKAIIAVPRTARSWAIAYRLAPRVTATCLARGYRESIRRAAETCVERRSARASSSTDGPRFG